MILKVKQKGKIGFESFLNRHANIKELENLKFVETPTKQFPDGYFEFTAVVNDSILNSYLKRFEPEKFDKRRVSHDEEIKHWNKNR